MKTLKDKLIIITGAGGAIAGEVEDAFRHEGARLVLVDKDDARVKGRASSFGSLALESDFATLAGARELIAQIKETVGPIDGLVHLVGEVVVGNVQDATEEDYDHAFGTNMRTLFNTVKAALPELLERDEAFIGSIASHEAWGVGQPEPASLPPPKAPPRAFCAHWTQS